MFAKVKLVKTKNPQKVPQILRGLSKPVDKITPEILNLIEKMAEIMDKNDGAGISAVQVGVPLRIMIVRVGEDNVAFINPEILKLSGKKVFFDEGCLSFPGLFASIERPENCRIRSTFMDGSRLEIEATGIVSRAFQHEIDHMDGMIFFDRAGGAEKLKKAK